MKMIKCVLAATALVATVSIASAADMSRPVYKATPAAAPVAYNWSGFYIGAHGGYAWGDLNGNLAGLIGSQDIDGGFGGGQLGWNWQAPGSPWVFGIEADASFASVGDTVAVVGGSIDSDIDSFGTIRARLGYAVDRTLWYVTGGAAWVNNEITVTATGIGSLSSSNTHWGWTIGGGVEWAFYDNWSLKAEYLYIDTSSENYFTTILGTALSFDPDIHTVRVGLNYRFGGGGYGKGPVVAKY
jgi:outer membrane immunogenic protein